MTQMRSSSWTASEAHCRQHQPFHLAQFHHLRTAPAVIHVRRRSLPRDCTTRSSPHNVCTDNPSFAVLPPGHHTSCTFLPPVFVTPPFLPGRIDFRTLGLLLYIDFVFFFVMREVQSRCIHSPLSDPRWFSLSSMRYTLTTLCTHLISRATFTPFTRPTLDTLEMTDTYDACIPCPIPSLLALSFT